MFPVVFVGDDGALRLWEASGARTRSAFRGEAGARGLFRIVVALPGATALRVLRLLSCFGLGEARDRSGLFLGEDTGLETFGCKVPDTCGLLGRGLCIGPPNRRFSRRISPKLCISDDRFKLPYLDFLSFFSGLLVVPWQRIFGDKPVF